MNLCAIRSVVGFIILTSMKPKQGEYDSFWLAEHVGFLKVTGMGGHGFHWVERVLDRCVCIS